MVKKLEKKLEELSNMSHQPKRPKRITNVFKNKRTKNSISYARKQDSLNKGSVIYTNADSDGMYSIEINVIL